MTKTQSFFIRSLILVTILLSTAVSQATASFIPFDWNLATNVYMTGGSQNPSSITQVNSPFQHTLFSSMGLHTSQAIFDFDFHPESGLGRFDTAVQLNVGAASGMGSSFTGRVKITPTIDTPIHMETFINYVTPSTPVVDVSVQFIVFDVANPTPFLYFGGGTGGTLSLNPAVGTISRTGDRVLLAGHTYQIGWDTRIRTVTSPLPGGPSTVSGYFNWSLTPEPGTALMVGLAVPILLRRNLRHQPIRP